MKKLRLTAMLLALLLLCSSAFAETAPYKDETVYVITRTDGDAGKVIVSDRFQNMSQEEMQTELAGLTDPENISGDSCWQGISEKELPVRIHVTYTLDGEEISAEELAGRNGHVTMRFDYENTLTETVTAGDREEELCVPFAVMTVVMLDAEHFSNIELVNGRQLSDGDRVFSIGIAFPGLSLQCGDVQPDVPQYFEITADTDCFELMTALTLATNALTKGIKLPEIDDADDMAAALKDAMSQLTDGSSALYDGLDTLLTSCGALTDGVQALSDGLTTLDSNSAAINNGALQVFEGILSTVNESLVSAGLPELTAENYADVLDTLISEPAAAAQSLAYAQVEAAVLAQEETVRAAVADAVKQNVTMQVTEAVQAEVWNQILASQNLTQDIYDAAVTAGKIDAAAQGQLKGALDAQMASEPVQALICEKTDEMMLQPETEAAISENTQAQIEQLIAQNMASEPVLAQIAAAAEQIEASADTLRMAKAQLDGYQTFYTGLLAYTGGVSQAAAGASELNGSMPALIEGITQLRDGSEALADGLAEFNNEAVESILTAYDDAIVPLYNRIGAMLELSDAYRSFEGTNQVDGTVKFIYRMDGIEAK